jgi:hypothetical protein
MVAVNHEKSRLRISAAADTAEQTPLQTVLAHSCAAEAACRKYCTHLAAYTIAEFLRLHGNLSKATFFNLRKRGDGPVVMKVGRRTLISAESAAEWRQRMTKVVPSKGVQ